MQPAFTSTTPLSTLLLCGQAVIAATRASRAEEGGKDTAAAAAAAPPTSSTTPERFPQRDYFAPLLTKLKRHLAACLRELAATATHGEGPRPGTGPASAAFAAWLAKRHCRAVAKSTLRVSALFSEWVVSDDGVAAAAAEGSSSGDLGDVKSAPNATPSPAADHPVAAAGRFAGDALAAAAAAEIVEAGWGCSVAADSLIGAYGEACLAAVHGVRGTTTLLPHRLPRLDAEVDLRSFPEELVKLSAVAAALDASLGTRSGGGGGGNDTPDMPLSNTEPGLRMLRGKLLAPYATKNIDSSSHHSSPSFLAARHFLLANEWSSRATSDETAWEEPVAVVLDGSNSSSSGGDDKNNSKSGASVPRPPVVQQLGPGVGDLLLLRWVPSAAAAWMVAHLDPWSLGFLSSEAAAADDDAVFEALGAAGLSRCCAVTQPLPTPPPPVQHQHHQLQEHTKSWFELVVLETKYIDHSSKGRTAASRRNKARGEVQAQAAAFGARLRHAVAAAAPWLHGLLRLGEERGALVVTCPITGAATAGPRLTCLAAGAFEAPGGGGSGGEGSGEGHCTVQLRRVAPAKALEGEEKESRKEAEDAGTALLERL